MSEQVIPEELILAKQLIDECKFDEAHQLIKNFEENGGHTLHDIVLCHLLKCELLFWRGLYEDVVKLAEQTYKESLGLGKNLLSVDILLIMAYALLWLSQPDKSQDIINQGEELLKALTQELPAEYKQREAYIAFLKGWFYATINDADQAIKQFELSISLREELGTKLEIALSLGGISYVFWFVKENFDRALKYAKRGMTVAKESGNKWCIGYFLWIMALEHSLKGELDRSIMLYEQSLTIFNDLNNKSWVAGILNSLGESYRMRGEFDRALEYQEQAMAINRESGNLRSLAFKYDNLIQILIDKGDFERASQCLHRLEQLNTKLKNKYINLMYLLDKALVLKTSSRALNRGKAEEILKQLIEEEDLDYDLIIKALLSLCELLLTELRITNDFEVLDELNQFIARLLDIAEKWHSYWILCETYLLQAKLALISLDLKEARRLLTQGQQISEKYGLTLLARKISNEHDELLKKLNTWENLKDSDISFAERMELARLNEQMEQMIRKCELELPDLPARLNEQMGQMIRKRELELPDLPDEDPIVLLIISEGGRPVFSKSFVEEWSFEDHLFGGFLTAINSFSDEMFSEGLDRANFGEYTIIMNSLHPFMVCYLFKGQTYLAQQRVKSFIDNIKNDKSIWKTLNEFNQICRVVQLKDIPLLEPLINEIFLEKSIPLN